MTLSIYYAEYFDQLNWAWMDVELIAEDEEQAREHIDKMCKPEFRSSPSRSSDKHAPDSLVIEKGEEAPIPFVLNIRSGGY